MSAAFVSGVGLGLTVAVPIGPMGLLCINRTLCRGSSAGLATGLGAATVHSLYGALAGLGLSLWLDAFGDLTRQALPLVSAAILFWFAFRLVLGGVRADPAEAGGGLRLGSAYGSAVLFGLTNPATLLLFASALPSLVQVEGTTALTQLAAGVFAGSLAWWTCLTGCVGALRPNLGPGAIALSNRLSGVALATLGVSLVFRHV